jgi:t-SNARE complex subunit (syntaxin)
MQEIVEDVVEVITPSASTAELDTSVMARRSRRKCKCKCKKIVIGLVLFVVLSFGFELALQYTKGVIDRG